ncbi:MAG TPA: SRPBCC family protein [Polyangiaceae bacterium]|nr:SRPBCC family protein [Polyangiaceae bacterium]
MLKKILIGLGALLVAFVAFVSTRPGTFRIERSARIDAPPGVVFAQVNDFHAWEAWSPWAKLDPNMKATYAGPASGVGASYAWAGNDEVGEGKMTLTESRAPQKVGIRLEFLKPFEATNTTEFTFTPSGATTDVVWSMQGTNNFVSKLMGVFVDMDAMIGADFEKGLASLKQVSEAQKPAEVALP